MSTALIACILHCDLQLEHEYGRTSQLIGLAVQNRTLRLQHGLCAVDWTSIASHADIESFPGGLESESNTK